MTLLQPVDNWKCDNHVLGCDNTKKNEGKGRFTGTQEK